MFETVRIGFIGGGNMGEALVRGLLKAALFRPDHIQVHEVLPARMRYLQETYGIQPCAHLETLAASNEIIILAVKPQVMATVLDTIRSRLEHRPLVVSIAAGIPLSTLAQRLAEGTPLIRVMPNTPALVLQGASALARGAHATDEHMQQALALFQAVGQAIEVEEKWMDAVTGLSGSGPAYVLLFMESLMDAGVFMGLPRDTARTLVVQTVLGTAMMVQETGKHPAELKDMITSPAGTTIHGLKVLEDRSIRGAFMEAVQAATLRSQVLGKG